MKIRRVVTGHDEAGKAVFVEDRELEPLTVSLSPGAEYHRLWGGNEAPSFPDDGSPPDQEPFFPAVGGYRFLTFQVPPGHRQSAQPDPSPSELEAGLAELDAKLPGMADHMEADAPGMHTTATVDFEIVLEGEVWLELDDGAEVHLKPGDAVVQNGTRHAWRNKGDVPARLVAFIVGAHHARVPRPSAPT
jgi:mannose-6-phosphate isomerase-like protein (cupin superfamily)